MKALHYLSSLQYMSRDLYALTCDTSGRAMHKGLTGGDAVPGYVQGMQMGSA